MISGASENELIIANARADIMLKLDNTATYESWLIIDDYIEQLEQALIDIREYINRTRKEYNKQFNTEIDWLYIKDESVLQIIDKVLGGSDE